jgi:uncharacterized protein (TIGR00255 family)
MTGYGMADGAVGGGRLTCEVRTVNHRHFSVQLRLPAEVQPLEQEIKARLRTQIDRGHVSVGARWTERPEVDTEIAVDLDRARSVIAALTRLKEALELPGDVDLGFLARQPDVLTYSEPDRGTPDASDVHAVLEGALDAVVEMRRIEGASLAADLGQRLSTLEGQLSEIEERAPQRLTAERDRLREAVRALLEGNRPDDARLDQEIVLLADKLDISEEIVRLRAHFALFRASLARDDAVGKQLAFLGQEMLRETNTIGSKANDTAIAHAVIAMKGELERIREQVENIE